MSRRAVLGVLVLALCARADVRAQTTLIVPTEDVEDDTPADPVAQASAPRELGAPGDLPPVPARPPDGFAVMAFENRSGVRALDWLTTGVPLSLAEKTEVNLPVASTYDPWVVPAGPVIPATADAVAAFAVARGARWVWTGWVERPNWQLRLAISLWRVDAGAATSVGEVIQVAPFEEVHRMIGDAAVQLATTAGFTVGDVAIAGFHATASNDLYAYTLISRGVAKVRGTLGNVDVRSARHDLTKAIFIEPTNAMGQRLTGQLMLEFPEDPEDPKNASRAAGKFAYAVDLAPDYPAAVRAAAAAARAGGKADIARDLYEQVVRRRPWELEARLFLGEAMWQTGESEAALRELERVIAESPDDLRARRLVALVHSDRGDLHALVAELEQITARAPDDVQVRMDLAAAYAALGSWEQAQATYESVADTRPDDVIVLKLLGDVTRRRDDPAGAAQWYAKMAKAAPRDPRPPFLTGLAWLEAGDLDRAYKALINAQKLKEFQGDAYAALGAIQYRRGDDGSAVWYLERAARKMPRSPRARIAHAYVLLMRHSATDAKDELAAARALGADGPELDYLASIAHALLDEWDAAKASARAAIEARPGYAEARRALIAYDRQEVPAVEGQPPIELPFGDVASYEAAIDGALTAADVMAGVRKLLDEQYLIALAALGEGPGKDLSKDARRKPMARTCPLKEVAQPTIAARKLEKSLYRRGNVLGEAVRTVFLRDELGESAGLTPAYRRKVIEVRKAWKRALVGVREVRSELTQQLGRELKTRRCSDALLVAAVKHPELYGKPTVTLAVPVTSTPIKRPPAPATLYIDNRECTDPVELWIDGVHIGTAPGGQRTAFEGSVGQRSVCLLGPESEGSCGDLGTVRQAYLHDGWSALLHCRGATQRAVDALPTMSGDGADGGVEEETPDAGVDGP